MAHRLVLILFTYFWGPVSMDSVHQEARAQTALEGETVTIKCTYSTNDPFPYLFWYQRQANNFPQLMLKRFSGSSENEKPFEKRFDASLNLSSSSVPLTIQNVIASDSAVYYCALKPTET
ncbi:hypothetical protein DNTS_010202, partial [Danionella cerebrum]